MRGQSPPLFTMRLFKILLVFIFFLLFSYFYLFNGAPSADVIQLRFVRFLLALFAGFSLSINGAVLQTITQNPLAEPYLVGISGGALIGYLIGLGVSLQSPFSLSLPAFLFSLVGVFITYKVASVKGSTRTELLVLTGVFINIFASSIVFLVAYFLNLSLDRIIYLLFGSLNIVIGDKELLFFYISIGLGFILEASLILLSRELDLIALGDEEAHSTGVNPEMVKKTVFIISSITTAFLVSFTGIIGFVGLIIPHITRSIFGKKHLTYLPSLLLTGGLFLLASDFVAKSLFSFELPLGSITSLFGIPFFFYMIMKRRHESI